MRILRDFLRVERTIMSGAAMITAKPMSWMGENVSPRKIQPRMR